MPSHGVEVIIFKTFNWNCGIILMSILFVITSCHTDVKLNVSAYIILGDRAFKQRCAHTARHHWMMLYLNLAIKMAQQKTYKRYVGIYI